jgi:hypothetical protein
VVSNEPQAVFRTPSPLEELIVRYPKFLRFFLVPILLLICFVFFDRSLCLFSQAQSNDAEAIRGMVGRLLDLYQQKDLNILISFWSQKSPFLVENKTVLQEEFRTYEKIAVKDFDIRQMKIDGHKATVRVAAENTCCSALISSIVSWDIGSRFLF